MQMPVPACQNEAHRRQHAATTACTTIRALAIVTPVRILPVIGPERPAAHAEERAWKALHLDVPPSPSLTRVGGCEKRLVQPPTQPRDVNGRTLAPLGNVLDHKGLIPHVDDRPYAPGPDQLSGPQFPLHGLRPRAARACRLA